MLQAVGIGHVKRIEKTSLGRHADGRLLAETFPVGLYAQDIRHALRVIEFDFTVTTTWLFFFRNTLFAALLTALTPVLRTSVP